MDKPQPDIQIRTAVRQGIDQTSVGSIQRRRQAYHQPYFLAELEQHFAAGWQRPDRAEVVEQIVPYIDRQLAEGMPLNSITRHLLGLFAGQPGARAWRRYISEHAHRDGAGSEVLINALNAMPAAA